MTSNIVAIKIPVSRKGQMCFFQANIPKDASAVTGVQAGIQGIGSALGLTDSHIAGTIRLQAGHVADLCYCTDIFVGRGGLEKMQPGFEQFRAQADFFSFAATGNTHANIDRVHIRDCHTLYGCYQDAIGKDMNRNIAYTIWLYIWTKLTDDKKNNP